MIAKIARQYQDQFEAGHVATGPANRFIWHHEPNYPLNRIANIWDARRIHAPDGGRTMIAQLASDRYVSQTADGPLGRAQRYTVRAILGGFEVLDTRTGQASINTWTLYRDRAEKWAANSNLRYAQWRALARINGDMGNFDCGTLDAIIHDNANEQGFDPNTW